MLHFVIVACMANKENLRQEMRVQPAKGRNTQEDNANDLFRLRGVNLKIKLGHFQKITKHISMENLVIINPCYKKRGGTSLADLCCEIGPHIVDSSILSSRVLW